MHFGEGYTAVELRAPVRLGCRTILNAAKRPRGSSDVDEVFIEPAMRPILEAMRAAASGNVPRPSVTPQQMRLRAAQQFEAWNRQPPALTCVRDLDLPARDGPLRARYYDPDGRLPAPLLLYLHGGGWVAGDLDIEDRALRILAQASGAKIVSLDYRLAPEHPLPAAIEDTVAAFGWLREHALDLGGSARALALGGASAGANIALAAALRLRDQSMPLPAQLVLFYGVYGADRNTESDRLFGTPEFSGPLANMELFYSSYAGSPEQRRNPLVAPLLADLQGLPPTFVNAAGIDPLRDDSRQLRDRLLQSGVPVSYVEYPGVVHGFTQFTLTSATARKALSEAGAAIKVALADAANLA